MNAFEQKLLSSIVEVEEALIWGDEKGKQGRSHGTKKPVMMALEIGKYVKTPLLLTIFELKKNKT